MVARYGVRPGALGWVAKIPCSVCVGLSRKPTEPSASGSTALDLAFRDLVAVDEFFVNLSDADLSLRTDTEMRALGFGLGLGFGRRRGLGTGTGTG